MKLLTKHQLNMKLNHHIQHHHMRNLIYILSDDYKVKPNLHVGSTNKLLEPYNVGSFRSRLPEPDAPILTKNAS